jgi:RIO kinase 1
VSRIEKYNPHKQSSASRRIQAAKGNYSGRGALIRELTFDDIKRDAIGFGLATDVLHQLNAGKEASIYLATWREHPIILKAYRMHQSCHRISKKHGYSSAASAKRTHNVLAMMEDLAVKEFDLLMKCFRAGMHVPTPVGRVGQYLTMRFIGDVTAPAPQIRNVELQEPSRALDQILDDYLVMYRDVNYVHGDLSEYNILWWEDRPWIIDVPQAEPVDKHCDMMRIEAVLRRDLQNLLGFFENYHVYRDLEQILNVFLSAYIPDNQKHYRELRVRGEIV